MTCFIWCTGALFNPHRSLIPAMIHPFITTALGWLHSGSLRVTRTDDAGEVIHLANLVSGDFFGEVALLQVRPCVRVLISFFTQSLTLLAMCVALSPQDCTRSATVTASSKCLLFSLSRQKFQLFLQSCPEFQQPFMQVRVLALCAVVL